MLDLFRYERPINILPKDGIALYHGRIFNPSEADIYFDQLNEDIKWENDKAMIFGKEIITKRKVAWYAMKPYSYTYSGITKKANLFTEVLIEIKSKVELLTGYSYNACLLNLYHDGTEGMAYHSDAELDLVKDGSIASVSFGAERKFSFKHKMTKEKIDVLLENGSLLDMREKTQSHWLHRLPPTTKIKNTRINLTFRIMRE
jgi:alkylated DNA repair dioxygenase AlkB